ncbi:MAG: hypothetical protein MJZ62_03880 [Bacteroidales bacterium]|nr:hypothetical protein [Bacteroidales bacterium]
MNYIKKHILLVLLAMMATSGCLAQYKPGKQLSSRDVEMAADADTSRLKVHGSIFTGLYSGYGFTQSYLGAAPTLTYQASDNLWIAGTVFAVAGDRMPSYAPYRNGRPPMCPEFHPGQMGLAAYGAIVSMRYKTSKHNYWDLHLSIMNDRGGLLTPMFMNPYCPMGGYGFGMFGSFGDGIFGF